MGGAGRSSSSSGEEDGDAEWRAAIDSVASATSTSHSTSNGSVTKALVRSPQDGQIANSKSQSFKHYQIKAQKLLDDILEKTIEIVRDPGHVPDSEPATNEVGIRLFRQAPPGIVFDLTDGVQQPRKRPRFLPGKEIDEKSKKFRRQLRSVVIDGMTIVAAARDAGQKSLAKLEAKDEAAKAAAKREEERVAELKRTRGERWLPSIAKDMQWWIWLPRVGSDMAILLAMVVDGLGRCVTALLNLQERRFTAIFNVTSSAARSLTMALVFCILSVHQRHAQGELGVALF